MMKGRWRRHKEEIEGEKGKEERGERRSRGCDGPY